VPRLEGVYGVGQANHHNTHNLTGQFKIASDLLSQYLSEVRKLVIAAY